MTRRQRGMVLILALGLARPQAAPAADDTSDEALCFDVPEYQGINAIPPVTMQIYPSAGGDTVVNDAEAPPGTGALVVVGFWEVGADYTPRPGDNPCQGEPTLKIAYPVDYGTTRCFSWKHWKEGRRGLQVNESSANNFSCDTGGGFHHDQWPTLTCNTGGQEGETGTPKSAWPKKCCRDVSSTIYSQILSGCGKEPPGVETMHRVEGASPR